MFLLLKIEQNYQKNYNIMIKLEINIQLFILIFSHAMSIYDFYLFLSKNMLSE